VEFVKNKTILSFCKFRRFLGPFPTTALPTKSVSCAYPLYLFTHYIWRAGTAYSVQWLECRLEIRDFPAKTKILLFSEDRHPRHPNLLFSVYRRRRADGLSSWTLIPIC